MRKKTQSAIDAFLKGKSCKLTNTEVVVNETSASGTVTQLYLFGHLIAEDSDTGFKITLAGYFTNTTKERLNGFPNVYINVKNGKWFLNGKEWNGEWTTIK